MSSYIHINQFRNYDNISNLKWLCIDIMVRLSEIFFLVMHLIEY